MKDLILKNSEWYRRNNQRDRSSLLVDGDGKKCCIGVLSCQEGVPVDKMLNCSTPCVVANPLGRNLQEEIFPENLQWLFGERILGSSSNTNSFDCRALMEINDDPITTDKEKIEKMRPILARHGFNVIFKPNE